MRSFAAALLVLAVTAACGSGSAGGSSAPAGSSSAPPTSSTAAVSTTGACAAAVHAEDRTIPKLLDETVKPSVTLSMGPSPALGITRTTIAQAKQTMRRIVTALRLEVKRYTPCLGASWAANVNTEITPLAAFLQ
jgi:hypothetical protein